MSEAVPVGTVYAAAAAPPELAPRGWSAHKYIWVLIAAGGLGLPAFLVGWGAGGPLLGGLIASVPFALLILYKPEFGVYLLAIGIPFETLAPVGPATALKILGLFTFVSFLIHLVADARVEYRSPAFLLALALATWSMLAIMGTQVPELAWEIVLTRYQLVGLFLLVISLCQTKERVQALYWALVLGALGAAILGFISPAQIRGTVQEASRLTIGGQDINQYAKDLMPAVFLVPFLITRSRGWLRPLLALVVPVILIALVATGSRSNYVALLAGLLVATLMFRGISWPRRVALCGGVLAVVGLFVLVIAASGLWSAGLWERMVEMQQKGLATGKRQWMWEYAIQMGLDHPLLGVGPGNYRLEVLRQSVAGNKVPHNDILTFLAETGFPGAILYCGFVMAVVVRATKVSVPLLRASLLGLVTAAFVASLANPSFGLKGYWMQMAAIAVAGTAFFHPVGSQEKPTLETHPGVT